jgi:hypothetical protein
MTAVDFASLASKAMALPSPAPEPWLNPGIWAADQLAGGEVNTTTRLTLFKALEGPAHWDFIVVDIGDGKRWLASRLFIFSILLKELRGLRSVVIVESAAQVKRKLLGITTPDEVRSSLAARYPCFDKQLIEAVNVAAVAVFRNRISLDQAQELLNVFLDGLQSRLPPDQNGLEWSEIETGHLWEASPWLTRKKVNSDLSSTFYDLHESTIERASVHADLDLYTDVMRCQEPFVAIVNAQGEFLDLFYKQAIVDRFVDLLNGAFGTAPVPPLAPVSIHVQGGELIMGDKNTTSGGDTINLSGQFHGAVYVKSTLSGVIKNVNNFGAASPQDQDEIKAALEKLSALLQTLPENLAPMGKKIADNAKEVVEAAQNGEDKSFFEGCANTLKTWAEKVSTTVPAIVSAASTLITAVGQVRGWL